MLQAELRVVGGHHDGELIPLSREKFLIGREEDCHLRPNSDLVSRHHCAFSIDDYSVRLRDLGSTNGTLVNDKRLRGEIQISAGDRVTVGNLCLELQIGDTDAPTAPAEIQEESSSSTPILHGETSEISAEETSLEIPIHDQPAPEEQTAEPIPQPVADYPQPQQPGYPYPQQPMGYPQQPMGYPQQPMGYPSQPGYYPQYPQQPMGYPSQMMPGQPVPSQFQPPVEPPAAEEPAASVDPDSATVPKIRLPDPSDTGVKAAAPKENAEGSAPVEEEKNPAEHAADIIRQHMNRRPPEAE